MPFNKKKRSNGKLQKLMNEKYTINAENAKSGLNVICFITGSKRK